MIASDMVFVFGSNLRGIHGGGAAKYAFQTKGAVMGKGTGRYGNSYAIPTKGNIALPNGDVKVGSTLSLNRIAAYVEIFKGYAEHHPEEKFQVTQIGCGLAGLTKEDIAPMFADAPDNCFFDSAWADILPGRGYWGTA